MAQEGKNLRVIIDGTVLGDEVSNSLTTDTTVSERRTKDRVKASAASTTGNLTAEFEYSDFNGTISFEGYLRDKQASGTKVKIERAFFQYDGDGNRQDGSKEFKDGGIYIIQNVGDTAPTEGGFSVTASFNADGNITRTESVFTAMTI